MVLTVCGVCGRRINHHSESYEGAFVILDGKPVPRHRRCATSDVKPWPKHRGREEFSYSASQSSVVNGSNPRPSRAGA